MKRSFSHCGAHLWNNLPESIRTVEYIYIDSCKTLSRNR